MERDALRARVAELEAELRSLNESAAVSRRILEVVPTGIVHVAPSGKILLANEQAQRFLGLGFDELTSSYTVDFAGKTYKDDGSECTVEEYPVTRCLVTGEQQPPMTIGVQQANGDVHWAIFTAMPVPHPEGTAAVVTFVDITERKDSEEERARMQERLQRADRLAAIGTLAAGVAHEINNPLTFILGNLSVASAMIGQSDLRRLVDEAREGAERVSGIVRSLGRFARIDDGAGAPFDVCAAVDTAVAMARGELRHRARLEVSCGGEPGRAAPRVLVQGHEGRAVQVFLNLLVNSAQAIEPGRVAVNLVRVEVRRRGDRVDVEVSDTGSGMSPEVLKRAFDPFFTTKPVGQGTGLGLSISHGIVQAMGGEIDVESASGEGTRVVVSLPVAPPEPEALGRREGAGPEPTGLRVLVVDDEPGIRGLLAAMLRDHVVAQAASGREALERCRAERFDVILCDLMMPDLTGMDVYEALSRDLPELTHRVVFMTGGAFTARASAFLEHVGNRVLPKPFTIASVREAIAAVVSAE